MVPAGEADYFVALARDQIEPHRWLTGEKTVVISPDAVDVAKLKSRRSLNVALLGVLSTHLDVEERYFVDAIRESFKEELREPNLEAFGVGRGGRGAVG
jgi:indolepyruvate ferredoxin oxidoreductase beta subunit